MEQEKSEFVLRQERLREACWSSSSSATTTSRHAFRT